MHNIHGRKRKIIQYGEGDASNLVKRKTVGVCKHCYNGRKGNKGQTFQSQYVRESNERDSHPSEKLVNARIS